MSSLLLYSADTIFFATEAYEGFGGYDLFRVGREHFKKGFERPQNLGKPFNSSSNDSVLSNRILLQEKYFLAAIERTPSTNRTILIHPAAAMFTWLNIPKVKEVKEEFTNLEACSG
jgi:hypothetical protein